MDIDEDDRPEQITPQLPPKKLFFFLALLSFFFKGLSQDFQFYFDMWGSYWLDKGNYEAKTRETQEIQDMVRFLDDGVPADRNWTEVSPERCECGEPGLEGDQ